jgi:hypothetical protein
MWVDVGFRFENPHQAGLSFSGSGGFDVGFTVNFWWILIKITLVFVVIFVVIHCHSDSS